MGRSQAEEFARHADLHAGLHWHLTANHYPPVPAALVPACVEAIKLCAAGDHRETVKLPGCVKYNGGQDCPAWALVDHLHLEPWVDRVVGHVWDAEHDGNEAEYL